MKKLLQLPFFCLAIIAISSCSETAVITRADNFYENYNYPDAISRYKYALKHGHENQQYLMKRLANGYRLQGDYENASIWYEKLVKFERVEPVEYFHYAKVLESEKKFAEAQQWFDKYKSVMPSDSRAFTYSNYSVKKVSDLYEDKKTYELFNLKMNTEFDEFSPAWYGDYVVFTSNRPDQELIKRKHSWNDTYYLDYFIAEKETDGQLKRTQSYPLLNSPYHDGPLTFSENGDLVIFTRNTSNPNGKLIADDKSTVRLSIFSSQKINDGGSTGWSEPKELPFNISGYSCQHPTLSKDGRKLYFASDMPGGNGGMDLYVCEKRGWSWGQPKNLGNNINTSGDEVFPYIYKDSLLYFSSNGHLGLGGLDVFVTSAIDYTYPANLGYPINDAMDDFGFIIDGKGKRGYFSSNREGGQGRDDIYGFDVIKNNKYQYEQIMDTTMMPLVADNQAGIVTNPGTAKGPGRVTVVVTGGIQLQVYDQITGKGLPHATINIFDKRGVLLNAVQMKGDGTNRISHNYPSGELRFIAFYGDYSSNRVLVEMKDLPANGAVVKIPMVKDLGKMLNINPIYFDYNRDNIRPDAARELDKIVKIMKENPGMVIEVASHTDSRGQYGYNQDLSQRRAQSSMKYIINHGISSSRISGKGYGETQLTNQCEDDIACSEPEHQYNRRTEFRILKFE